MAFGLSTVLTFIVLAFVHNVLPARWRVWSILIGSALCLYWMQPALPIRFADFILPTLTLMIIIFVWHFVGIQPAFTREDRLTLLLIVGLVIGLSFMRFVDTNFRLTPSRPPDPLWVIIALVAASVPLMLVSRLLRRFAVHTALWVIIFALVALFIVLKAEPLAVEVSRWWRTQTAQDTSLASLSDLTWLGFSYIAFRLIHTLRDRQTGILPTLSLREYLSHILFFPALAAGPIDRAERFTDDLRGVETQTGLDAARFADGLSRIAFGIFKKFVIADTLAQGLALNTGNAAQSHSTPVLWLLFYGYGFRLFFDFSGYTDIAIGMALLFGIRLPENFNRPYLKSTLTAFWQSWHITLSDWVRLYVFSPLSRALLMRKPKPSPTLIVLSTQLTTMIIIGLWHGITWNFLIWGIWHGVGLFIHKQWSDRTRKWYRGLNDHPAQKRLWTGFSWFINFHYVMLGWVWFALPDTASAIRVIKTLFGAGG